MVFGTLLISGVLTAPRLAAAPVSGRDANLARLIGDTQAAATGPALADCLAALAWERTALSLPAPDPLALRELIGSQFPSASADSALAQPWPASLRAVLRQTLTGPASDREQRHAIALMPLFFTRAEAAQIAPPDTLWPLLAAQPDWLASPEPEAALLRRNLGWWLQSRWQTAEPAERTRLALGIRQAGCPLEVCDRVVPLSAWLLRHPAALTRLLAAEDRAGRQAALAELLREPLATPAPELLAALTPALIEALADDTLPGNARRAQAFLQAHRPAMLDSLTKAFRASDDWQQKTRLALVLESAGRPDIQQALTLFYSRLLTTVEAQPEGHNPAWPGRKSQQVWAIQRLIALGPSAAPWLKTELAATLDPLQAAQTLLVLDRMQALPAGAWNESLLHLLATGMRLSPNRADRAVCRKALALADPQLIAGYLRKAGNPKAPSIFWAQTASWPRDIDAITAYNTLLAERPQDRRF